MEQLMRIGIKVRCATCGKPKAPRGRSVPAATWDEWCNHGYCKGYFAEPLPGDLWPDETEDDFGYPVSPNATRVEEK